MSNLTFLKYFTFENPKRAASNELLKNMESFSKNNKLYNKPGARSPGTKQCGDPQTD